MIVAIPKDNKFLELALSAKAKLILSSDLDLLVLNPYQDICDHQSTITCNTLN